jgi:hypothetical protein
MKAIHGLCFGACPDSFVVGVSTCAFPDMARSWRLETTCQQRLARTDPLEFIGDDPHGPAVYSTIDDKMAYSPDPFWEDHMRVRPIMDAEERDWNLPSKQDRALWERATTESFEFV